MTGLTAVNTGTDPYNIDLYWYASSDNGGTAVIDAYDDPGAPYRGRSSYVDISAVTPLLR